MDPQARVRPGCLLALILATVAAVWGVFWMALKWWAVRHGG